MKLAWRVGMGTLLGICVVLGVATLPAQADSASTNSAAARARAERLLENGIYLEARRMLESHVQAHPSDIAARRLLGRTYLQLEEYYLLREQAAQILQLRPEDEEAGRWLRLADEQAQKQFPETFEQIQRELEADPDNVFLRQQLLNLLEQQRSDELAAEQYERLIAQNPQDMDLVLRYARFLATREQLEKAQQYYRRYLEARPDPTIRSEMFDLTLRRAAQLMEQKRYEQAGAEFEKAIARHPDELSLRLQYARTLSWAQQYEHAAAAYQDYLARTEDPQAQLELAHVLAWAGRTDQAVGLLREMIHQQSENLDAQVLLGDIYRWNDDPDMARQLYEDVLQKHPQHAGAREGLEALTELAQQRQQSAERLNIPAMEAQLAADPSDHAARLQLARLYNGSTRHSEAAEQFRIYLSQQPADTPVRREYAFALTMVQQYDLAVSQLRQYLDQFPDDLQVRMQVATIFMWGGQFDQAQLALQELLELAPRHLEAHWHLARIAQMNQDWDKALRHYRIVQELEPHHQSVEARIRQIQAHPQFRLTQMERTIQRHPNDVVTRMEMAAMLLELERLHEAREHVIVVLELNPRHDEAQRMLRYIDHRIARDRVAQIERLRTHVRQHRQDYDAHLELARLLAADAQYEQAIRHYRVYLWANPDDLDARQDYAQILGWMPEHRVDAIHELLGLLEVSPGDREMRVRLFQIAVWEYGLNERLEGEIQQLQNELRQVLAMDPDNAQARLHMAQLHELRSDWDLAIGQYLAVAQIDPGQAGPATTRASEIRQMPTYHVLMHERAVAQDPEDFHVRMDLAAMYFDMDRYYDAMEQARIVLRLSPSHPDARQLIDAAEARVARTRRSDMAQLRHHLRQNPRDVEAQLELARLLQAEGSPMEAIRRYQIYLRANPYNVTVRREYAQVLSWVPERREDALKELGELVELNPDDLEMRLYHARVLSWDRSTWDRAERELKELTLLYPDEPQALNALADLYRSQERYTLARELYQQVIKSQYTPGENYYLAAPSAQPTYQQDRYQYQPRSSNDRLQGPVTASRETRRTAIADRGITPSPAKPRAVLAQADAPGIAGSFGQTIHTRQLNAPGEAGQRAENSRQSVGYTSRQHSPLLASASPSALPVFDLEPREQSPRQVAQADQSWEWHTPHWQHTPNQPTPNRDMPRPQPINRDRQQPASPWDTPRRQDVPAWDAPRQQQPSNWDTQPASPWDTPRRQDVPAWDAPRQQQPNTWDTQPASPWDAPQSNVDTWQGRPAIPVDPLPSDRWDWSAPAPARSSLREAVLPPENRHRGGAAPSSQAGARARDSWQRFEMRQPYQDDWQPSSQGGSGSQMAQATVRLDPLIMPDNDVHVQQAREGLASLGDIFRPMLSGRIAYMEDNEDYSELQLGVRYDHFVEDGTRLHLGWTHFRLEEDGAPYEKVDGNMLAAGVTSELFDRMVGSAELTLSEFDHVDIFVGGMIRGAYAVTPTGQIALDLARYQVMHEVKTVRSLVEDIHAHRMRLEWISTPGQITGKPWTQRIFFAGDISHASYSDGNSLTAFAIRPFIRLREQPNVDLIAGWRSLSFARRSQYYWSPGSYHGPLIGGRISGQTFWDLDYSLDLQLFIPNEGDGPATSLSASLSREIVENLSLGLNLSVSDSPRDSDTRYRHWGGSIDLRLRF